MLGVA